MEWLPSIIFTLAIIALCSSAPAEMSSSSNTSRTRGLQKSNTENYGIRNTFLHDTETAVNDNNGDEQGQNDCQDTESNLSSSSSSAMTTITSQAACLQSQSPPSIIEESSLKSWDLDILKQSKENLVDIILQIFVYYNLCERFGIPDSTLRNMIVTVQEHMPDNPYHNFHHVASVVHFSFLILSVGEADRYLTDRDIFAILFATLIHDLDHPGNNNGFEVKTQSQLALKYGNESILENYAIDSAFKLMNEDVDLNVFNNVGGDDSEYIMNAIRNAVLYTDMSKHFELMKRVMTLADKGPVSCAILEEDEAARQTLIQLIVHASDISGPGLPVFELFQNWSVRVCDEFSQQVDKERKIGLEVTAMMAGLDNEFSIATSQVDFIRIFALPCLEIVAILFPGTSSIVTNCLDNSRIWQGIADNSSPNT